MDDLSKSKNPAKRQAKPAPLIADDAAAFDEKTYLKFNPDVAQAVAAGVFASGRVHFEQYGRAEGRPCKMLDAASRNRVVVTGRSRAPAPVPPSCGVESLRLSSSGGIFVIGWVNDAADALDSVDLYFLGWSVSLDAATLARPRRMDVESAIGAGTRHAYGFWGFLFAGAGLPCSPCNAVVRLKSGAEQGFTLTPQVTGDYELRKIICAYLATNLFFGPAPFAAAAAISGGIAGHLVALNRAVSRTLLTAPHIARFGGAKARYRGSFIVCLYGRPEFLFLQAAVFARQKGMQDYEMIFICNSPQLGQALLAEAARAALIYGIDLTVILLPGNAGFAAANNEAARHARSDRLLFLNPDSFPRQTDFVAKHSALLADLPPPQTDLFGAPLYYADGSLMHGGMYLRLDTSPNMPDLLRVAHYGKGAPPDTEAFLRPRKVPAVSGAFMSVNRAWFETLGGFNQDYLFGHYEDADFCLQSLRHGRAAWLHDIPLWHLEGQGSTKLRQHEGGAIINRLLFTQNWAPVVSPGLLGPTPAHPAFAPP